MSAVLSQAQVCGVVLLRRDGAALLQHRDDIPGISDPGLWVFPGGHREDQETSEQAARREFLEETRYQCGELQSLGLFSGETLGYQDDLTLEFFWARFDEGGVFECCEGQELRFVPREEMEQLPVVAYLSDVWDRALLASQGVPMGLRPTKVDEDAECKSGWQAKAPAPRWFVQVGQALPPANSGVFKGADLR